MSISRTSVRKPVTVLIIFILLILLGLNSAQKLAIELIPDLDIPYVIVMTTYRNASPEEVEDKVTKTLESSLSSVSGIKKLSSTSSEGQSMIMMEFEVGTNLDDVSITARDRIDLVRDYLPEDADSPILMKLDPSMMPIMVLVMNSSTRTADEIKKIANDVVSPRIEQLDGVASVSLMGGRERAIRVEIPKDRLDAYGLTFSSVGQMIAAQNMNSSVGNIVENGIEYSVQADGLFTSVEEIGNTVISYKASSDGQMHQIKLNEIADVYDGYKDADSFTYSKGDECVALTVSKQTGKNSVATANKILNKIDELESIIPSDCEIQVVYNTAEEIENAIDNVASSAITGAVFAILVLLVFLRAIKSTFIIGITIPVSIIITMLLMYYSGFSLNLMTLSGLALGVGMLVDNAVVVLENIFSYQERGTKPTVAAILGSEEMVMAITSSTLTTICVFLPLVMYKKQLGILGQIFDQLSLTIVYSLLSSLVVAITLVPVLSSKYLVTKNLKTRKNKKFFYVTEKIFSGLDNGYAKAVRWVLHHKTIFIAVILILFVLSIKMAMSIGFTYMPEQESTSLTVNVELAQGTDLETTRDTITRIDKALSTELKGVKTNAVMIGSSMMMGGSGGSNTGTIMYMFYNASEREEGWDNGTTAKAKVEHIKDDFPEAKITVSESSTTSAMGGSSGIAVKVISTDLDAVREVSSQIVKLLEEKAGDYVKDVDSSMEDGTPQLTIKYDRDKMYSLGINIATANAEVKANIGGSTFARYREQGEDVDVILTLPKEDKATQLDLEDIMVKSSFGTQVPLSAFATIVESKTALSISRENQSRIVTVSASSTGLKPLSETQKEIAKIIDDNIPLRDDVIIDYSGDYESMMNAIKTFTEIIIVAILMVFAVMAAQFESFLKPFIVLFSMPLAVIGIVAIYTVTGLPFNVITAVGCLILVGIVVNNGIVLVDYISLMQKRGLNLEEACVEAARSRLRPILMTTLTTVLALVPMGFFPGEGAEFSVPIGQTVLGGLTFSTLMTLFMMPTLYYIFGRGKEKRSIKRKQKELQEALMEDEKYAKA
ncbi:MAG: efflux RND transporter permease subunit [Sphaerochaetaceae bacterium]|nr:efflux RND transporter permease subunit [Sphaerochaetaceae bacterium]